MTDAGRPLVVVVAGPNGAGKSTTAPYLLRDALAVTEFVNADGIAAGLSVFYPERVAITAGRVMLQRLHALAADRQDFAFETTLASRSFAPWLADLRRTGYRAHLAFLSLPSPELALARVAERVRLGGHDVPQDVVRRRFRSGLRNLFNRYLPRVDSWQVFDNSGLGEPRLVATGKAGQPAAIVESAVWHHLQEYR